MWAFQGQMVDRVERVLPAHSKKKRALVLAALAQLIPTHSHRMPMSIGAAVTLDFMQTFPLKTPRVLRRRFSMASTNRHGSLVLIVNCQAVWIATM